MSDSKYLDTKAPNAMNTHRQHSNKANSPGSSHDQSQNEQRPDRRHEIEKGLITDGWLRSNPKSPATNDQAHVPAHLSSQDNNQRKIVDEKVIQDSKKSEQVTESTPAGCDVNDPFVLLSSPDTKEDQETPKDSVLVSTGLQHSLNVGETKTKTENELDDLNTSASSNILMKQHSIDSINAAKDASDVINFDELTRLIGLHAVKVELLKNGDCIILLGPTGSGKSSFINWVNQKKIKKSKRTFTGINGRSRMVTEKKKATINMLSSSFII